MSPAGLKDTSLYDDKGKSLTQGHKKQKESMTASFRQTNNNSTSYGQTKSQFMTNKLKSPNSNSSKNLMLNDSNQMSGPIK